MRRRLLLVILLLAVLSGCAGLAVPPAERKTPLPLPRMEPPPRAAQAVQRYLAESLGVDNEQVRVEQLEEVEWPDSCLGLPAGDGQDCGAQALPGYRWLAEALGERYLFHSDQDGNIIRLAAGPEQ